MYDRFFQKQDSGCISGNFFFCHSAKILCKTKDFKPGKFLLFRL